MASRAAALYFLVAGARSAHSLLIEQPPTSDDSGHGSSARASLGVDGLLRKLKESMNVTLGTPGHGCDCLRWAEVLSPVTGLDCNTGYGGLPGGEFCSFIKNWNADICLSGRYMPEGLVQESFCFVPEYCKPSRFWDGNHQRKYKLRRCNKAHDLIATEIPYKYLWHLGQELNTDQGALAGFTAVHENILVKDVTTERLTQIKRSLVPTLIWSMQDEFADRYFVTGDEIWVFKYAPDSSVRWNVSCKEGCSSDWSVR